MKDSMWDLKMPEPQDRVCPVCGKPRQDRFKPFCSRRCAQLDLSRWLKGVYAIPGRDEDEVQGPPGSGGGEDPA